MKKQLFSREANKVIYVLTKGLAKAMKMSTGIQNSEERHVIDKILAGLKSDIENYFSKHIDRRFGKREKELFIDISDYFASTKW